MRWLALALLITNLNAAVVLKKFDGRIEIAIDGKPFTTLYYGPEAPKPYLHPLRSASGKIVTRRFPMEAVPSDNKDRHHRGLWLGYKDINGFDFWENEFSYNNPKAGRVVMRGFSITEGTIVASFGWLGANRRNNPRRTAHTELLGRRRKARRRRRHRAPFGGHNEVRR